MSEQEPIAIPLNPDPLLDIKQGADFLFTSERHIRHLISKREITVTRIGNKVRFRVSDLNAYIVTRTTPAKVDQ
jgi:excisionase family DNA binding protein